MTGFAKICRACNSERTNLLNLFANDCDDDEPTLGEKFSVCTALELEEADVYPQNICYSCAKQLETAFKFRKLCERSHNQFMKKCRTLQREPSTTKSDIKEEPHTIIHRSCEKPAMVASPSENNNIVLGKQQLSVISIEDPVNIQVETANSIRILQSEFVDECQNDQLPAEQILYSDEDMPEAVKYVEYNKIDSLNDSDAENSVECIDQNVPITTEPAAGESTEPDIAYVSDAAVEKALVDFTVSIQDRPHKCDDCEKSFFTIKALELHTRLNHRVKNSPATSTPPSPQWNELNQCICSLCNMNFNSADEYKMHRILEHGEKAFECNICGKHIRNRIAFKKHLLAHKDSRPFICKVCGKQYTDYRYLYRHMLYHQNTIYKCSENECGKTFNVKHKFVEHIRLYHNRNITTQQVRLIQPEGEDDIVDGE